MAPTLGLGRRRATGVTDADQQINPFLLGTGWDVIFAPQDMATNVTEFEVYQIAIDGPVGSSVVVLIDGAEWNYVAQGWSNSYDPAQPLLLNASNTLQFCWNVAYAAGPYNKTTNILPVATIWLRRTETVLG